MTALQAWVQRNAYKYHSCKACQSAQVPLAVAVCVLCETPPKPEKPMQTAELQAELANHYGSETITRHSIFRSFALTEGAICFRNNAGGGCFWLFDLLATEPSIRTLVLETGFASVVFTVNDSNCGHLTVQADSGVTPVYDKVINYTDCPPGCWRFYLELPETEDGNPLILCLLPSEH